VTAIYFSQVVDKMHYSAKFETSKVRRTNHYHSISQCLPESGQSSPEMLIIDPRRLRTTAIKIQSRFSIAFSWLGRWLIIHAAPHRSCAAHVPSNAGRNFHRFIFPSSSWAYSEPAAPWRGNH
jgi:hypothetical protein